MRRETNLLAFERGHDLIEPANALLEIHKSGKGEAGTRDAGYDMDASPGST
jgi:hypothetical protein